MSKITFEDTFIGDKLGVAGKFNSSGKAQFLRVHFDNTFGCWDYVIIGNKKLDFSDYGLMYVDPPSALLEMKVYDYIINCDFKDGDDFVIEGISKINKVEIFTVKKQ